jgi:hypothetical protein
MPNVLTFWLHKEAQDVWSLPEVDMSDGPPFEDPRKVLLDDVEKELQLLLSKRPWNESSRGKAVYFHPMPSYKTLQRVLGCLDCKSVVPFSH